ncbi:MAG: hypothetical protein V3W41_07710 [Planctomycetota bacterium]
MKQIIVSSIAIFVLSMLLGFVVHGWLLQGDYDSSGLMRSPEGQEAKFGFMLLAHALIAVGFTLIYRKGREDKPWLGQGLRFGLLWALASVAPLYLIYHAVMPFELSLTCKQIVYDCIAIMLAGAAVSFLNQK